MEHPITPPPGLVERWRDEALNSYPDDENPCPCDIDDVRDEHIATQAANWGANQELEACCGWIESKSELGASFFTPEVRAKFRYQVSDQLRAARRPKPPSLKQQASDSLDEVVECLKMLVPGASVDGVHIETIRRALESLPDPQD